MIKRIDGEQERRRGQGAILFEQRRNQTVGGERGAEKARYEVRRQRGLPSVKASRYNARQKGNVLIKGGCHEVSVERRRV